MATSAFRHTLLSQLMSSEYWFGSDTSLATLLTSLLTGKDEGEKMLLGSDDEQTRFGGQYHYMLHKYGDVAVLEIRGDLVTYESAYNKYYGIVSYEEIRNAVATISRDPEISKILLKIDSPGGTAKGVDECCEALRFINENVMPIYTIACGTMCSAGYFLGSVGKKIFTTQLSVVGSIGAVRPLISYFNHLKEMGIDVHILRAPEFKALGHHLDPLNEKTTAILQKDTEQFTELFERSVALNRGTTVEIVRSRYGQGLTFIGEKAVSQGLADEVATFDVVIRRLRSNNSFI